MSKPIYDFEVMKCANCRSQWVTQTQTIAYSRTEDADLSAKVLINKCGNMKSGNVPSEENPSARRHSSVLIFECEHCTKKSAMFFIQHKGNTFMNWEVVK